MECEHESTHWVVDLPRQQIDSAWGLVRSAFNRLEQRSLVRQCPTKAEFEGLFERGDVFKIISTQGGQITQLSTFHTTPDSVPWVVRGHLDSTFAHEIASGVFGYVGITAALGAGHRNGLEHIFRIAEEAEMRQNSVGLPCRVGFDYSSRNRALPRLLLSYFKDNYPHFNVVDFGSQCYSLVDPTVVSEVLSGGAEIVSPDLQNEFVRAKLLAKHHLPDDSLVVRHDASVEKVEGIYTVETSVYGGVVARGVRN